MSSWSLRRILALTPAPRLASSALVALALGALATHVHAQTEGTAPHARPTAALLPTTKASAGDAALDPVLRAALDKLAVVNITAQPAMDLAAMQLALDCVDETPQCLRVVAEQNGVELLLAASVQHTGAELVVTLLYFDAQAQELRRVKQHQTGSELSSATLDAVPDMLRDLFKLEKPAATEAAAASEAAPQPVDEQPASAAPKRKIPVGPLIVAGGGVLVVIGGVVSGLMMQKTQVDFSALEIKTASAKRVADDTASRGKTEATVANVLYGVGAAAIAAGVVWMAFELTHDDREEAPQTALLPVVGGGTMGLTLVHRGASL